MRELNAQLRPLPIFLEVVAENKAPEIQLWEMLQSVSRKIAGIRWKCWSLALVSPWYGARFVQAWTMCDYVEEKKKNPFAFSCQNPSKCHVSIYASHTNRYTSEDRKDNECSCAS